MRASISRVSSEPSVLEQPEANGRKAIVEALDGNSIAGDLYELLGREMTRTPGLCTACGRPARLAELCVYPQAPGVVVRCRNCREVAFVLLRSGPRVGLHIGSFKLDHEEGL